MTVLFSARTELPHGCTRTAVAAVEPFLAFYRARCVAYARGRLRLFFGTKLLSAGGNLSVFGTCTDVTAVEPLSAILRTLSRGRLSTRTRTALVTDLPGPLVVGTEIDRADPVAAVIVACYSSLILNRTSTTVLADLSAWPFVRKAQVFWALRLPAEGLGIYHPQLLSYRTNV